MRRLYDADYVTGIDATSASQPIELLDIRLLERGLVEVREWPAASFDDLVVNVQLAIDREKDLATRSRMQRLLEGLTGAGRDVAVNVLSEWARRQM